MGKGSKRRQENFKRVQDNWPANIGKKPYWQTWSKVSDELYDKYSKYLYGSEQSGLNQDKDGNN